MAIGCGALSVRIGPQRTRLTGCLGPALAAPMFMACVGLVR